MKVSYISSIYRSMNVWYIHHTFTFPSRWANAMEMCVSFSMCVSWYDICVSWCVSWYDIRVYHDMIFDVCIMIWYHFRCVYHDMIWYFDILRDGKWYTHKMIHTFPSRFDGKYRDTHTGAMETDTHISSRWKMIHTSRLLSLSLSFALSLSHTHPLSLYSSASLSVFLWGGYD